MFFWGVGGAGGLCVFFACPFVKIIVWVCFNCVFVLDFFVEIFFGKLDPKWKEGLL